jgi:hypothetical protein
VVGKRVGWMPSAGPEAQKLAALADQAEAEVNRANGSRSFKSSIGC